MKNVKQKLTVFPLVKYKDVEKEYKFNIMNDENTNIMQIINELPYSEKTLIILYSELGSLKKVADIYNCDKTTIFRQINKIRAKIKNKIIHYD